ncbi:MAG: ABC transporter permease [Acidobacteria bacterium]|nr:ABC transporter permease [Acidobacteriota bacterium]
MSTLWQDIRFGLRMMLRHPAVTLVAVIALTLGIGANTAIFSVVNAILLRPLPYEESERLIFLSERSQQLEGMSISYPNFTDWRAQNRVFEAIGVYNRDSYNLTGIGEAERINAAQASADLFTVLRVKPALGRVYTNDEDKPGATPVVVLSHGLWQRRFGGDAKILNQTISLNNKRYEVIGIMPNGFLFPSRIEMWVPVGPLSDQRSWQQRGNHPGLYGVARLKPGITIEQARADMDNVAANLEKQYPDSNKGNRVTVKSLLENYVEDVRPKLWVILGAVGMVLLIACANVANLLLARATVRQKEMAIRNALGASRWRVVRQLLTESMVLSVIGGGLGLMLAQWGIELIVAISPNDIPRWREVNLDSTVLLFTIGVSLLTGIVFGLAPALHSSSVNVHETLKETGRGSTGTRQWVRNSLVVVEIATTLLLLIAAGLMIRSFYHLQTMNPGFSYDNLTALSLSLPRQKYDSIEQRASFYQRVIQNIQTLPGLKAVGAASGLPLGNNGWQTSFMIDGQAPPPPDQRPLMELCLVTPDYFRAMEIPLLRGRWFTDQDNREHLKGRDLSAMNEMERDIAGLNVMVVDEEFARRHWPNEEAIGKRILLGSDEKAQKVEVVGVVGRVKMEGLNQESNRVQGYFPFLQIPERAMTIVVKSAIDPLQMINAARQQVTAVDPDQPVYDVRTMYQIKAESISSERLNLTLLSVFAVVALILAIVGIYGVMSYSVTQRTHEIGIRLALGANHTDVLKLVIGQGMKLAMVGTVIGLGAAYVLTSWMKTLLFGIDATDPLTFAGVAMLLGLVAFLACYIPARRATKVDPMIALRYD